MSTWAVVALATLACAIGFLAGCIVAGVFTRRTLAKQGGSHLLAYLCASLVVEMAGVAFIGGTALKVQLEAAERKLGGDVTFHHGSYESILAIAAGAIVVLFLGSTFAVIHKQSVRGKIRVAEIKSESLRLELVKLAASGAPKDELKTVKEAMLDA